MREDPPSSVPERDGRSRDRADADDPLTGRVVAGKFAIETRLGRGAMGTVYRARQLALDKTVAVKVLNGDLAADPTFAERFGREAKAASRLDHPNSIRVFDFGQDTDGLLYLVMEYVEGRDLRAILSEAGPPSPAVVVHTVAQVLAALSVAHDMGVMHRDLKPENIMIVRGIADDGLPVDLVKVCDFGIAKIANPARAPGEKYTTSGLVVGTPEYMSPEQARGEAVDGRSDVYSIGVVLYELLVGLPPFEGSTPLNIVLQHIGEPPAPPSKRRPGIDPRLEAVCLRAIEKKPGDRFQTAREMRRALLDVVGTTLPSARGALTPAMAAMGTIPGAAPPSEKPTLEGVSPLGPVPAPRRARSWVVASMVIAGASAALAVALVTRHGRPPPDDPAPTASAPSAAVPTTEPGPAQAPSPLPTASAAVAPEPAPSPSRMTAEEPKVRSRRKTAPTASPLGTAEQSATNDTPVAVPAPPPLPAPPPAPGPVSVSAPVSAPAPLPAPLPAPGPAPAPAFDLSLARVDVGSAGNTIGVTSTSVSRTVAEASGAMTACYRAALPRLAGVIEGRGTLHVETDGDGVVTEGRLQWVADAALVRCFSRTVLGRRIANVDTGNASADVSLTFRAR